MPEAYFTPALFAFFRDLKKHNDRDWFAANRERYVRDVEAPMLAFIGDFGDRLRAISPAFVADKRRVGGSLFRLHRDTRFSPDKSPFKTWTAAKFSHEARRKVEGVPAFYLHLAPGESFAGGGVYHVPMPQLTRIRQRIVSEPRDWSSACVGLEIMGVQLKRAPSGFPATHDHIEDLKRQNLYTMAELTEDDVVAAAFMDRFTEVCERVAPLLRFQTKALGLRW